MTSTPSFAALAAMGSPSDKTHQVHIEDTQEVYPCSEKDNALNALARSGRKGIPVGCRGGGCGVCKVAVLSGSFQARVMSRSHVSADEEANGVVLACCIQPTSDLKLSVIGKLRKAVTRPRSEAQPRSAQPATASQQAA